MTDDPRYGGRAADHIAQLRAATLEAAERHDRLIAAGYTWDGMDGYTAPTGQPHVQPAVVPDRDPPGYATSWRGLIGRTAVGVLLALVVWLALVSAVLWWVLK